MTTTSENACSVPGCDSVVRARGWCKDHYNAWYRTGDAEGAKHRVNCGVCSVEGCESRPRSRTASHCEMHYYRLRRTGTTDHLECVAQPAIEHQNGYLLEYAPGHPLATPRHPHVYEHRKVFYDEKGPGPFGCHVCGKQVIWADLHVDHLDDNPRNNRIENLAPACPTCNRGRGAHKMIAANRAKGIQITAYGKTQCITVWAAGLEISRSTLQRRIAAGWSPERAIETPRGPTGPKTAAARARRIHDHTNVDE